MANELDQTCINTLRFLDGPSAQPVRKGAYALPRRRQAGLSAGRSHRRHSARRGYVSWMEPNRWPPVAVGRPRVLIVTGTMPTMPEQMHSYHASEDDELELGSGPIKLVADQLVF